LLVEHEPGQQGERILGKERVGVGVAGEVESVGAGRWHKVDSSSRRIRITPLPTRAAFLSTLEAGGGMGASLSKESPGWVLRRR